MQSQSVIKSHLGIPFTTRSTGFLSQWLFGQGGGFFTLVAARAEGGVVLGHAIYSGLRPGMTFDQIERTGVMWMADQEVLVALRSHLVDLAHHEGPILLPPRREPFVAARSIV